MKRLLILVLLLSSCKSTPPRATPPEPAPQPQAEVKPETPPAPVEIRPLFKAEPQTTTPRDAELFAIDAACQQIESAVSYGLQVRRQRIESDPSYREEATKAAYYLVLRLRESNNALAKKSQALRRFQANRNTLKALSEQVRTSRNEVAGLEFDAETIRRIDDGILGLTNTLR